MPDAPTTVVFDLGGVLVDWNPRRLYRKIFAEPARMERFLTEVCNDAWNMEQDRGRPFAQAVEELVSAHPGERLHIEAYFSRWPEMIGGPIAGTVKLLEALAAKGVPLFALSNWSAETFPVVRDDPRFAFFGRFERIFLSGEERLVKPDPAFYRHLLAATGRTAGQCLFIDDNRYNIEAAIALGFHAHHFTSPEPLRDELVRHRLLD